MAGVEDAGALEDDRLSAGAPAAKSWEADRPARPPAGAEVLQRLPECLKAGLVAAAYGLGLPGRELGPPRRSFSISEHNDL